MSIIGTGVDITEVKRLKSAIEKWGDEFLDRIFTPQEIKNARSRSSFYQHLAGRFAAKEAVFKALGNKSLSWKDVEVLNNEEGRPYCRLLNGKSPKVQVYVSISHVKNYAVASAVVAQKE